MIESTIMDFPNKYTVSMFTHDPDLEMAAEEFARLASQNGATPKILTGLTRTSSLSSVVTGKEQESGSVNFTDLNKKTKLVFLKILPAERDYLNTIQQLGLPIARYNGALIFDPNPYYLLAILPGEAINLSKVILCDNTPKESFDTFDVLGMTANYLAKLHHLDWIHGDFKVESFFLSSSLPSPVILYRAPTLHKAQLEGEKAGEIETFLASLKEINPNCPHDKYREFFTKTYKAA